MRQILVIILIAISCLTGCATDSTARPSSSELPGTYYSGDGLGRMVFVELQPNGTFSSDWHGCLGVYGEATGTWELQGEKILFSPTSEHEILVGYLRQATTIRRGGRLGFARTQDVEDEIIDEQLVFFKQP